MRTTITATITIAAFFMAAGLVTTAIEKAAHDIYHYGEIK